MTIQPLTYVVRKDKAAKFVDMLSAIGCTMGLLTGFSIIGAVAWSLVPGEVEPHPGVGEVLHHVHHLVHLRLLQARPASQPNLPSDEPGVINEYLCCYPAVLCDLAAAMDCATWTPSQLRRGSWPQGVAGLRLAQVEAGSQGGASLSSSYARPP